jgi:hypothetical protein
MEPNSVHIYTDAVPVTLKVLIYGGGSGNIKVCSAAKTLKATESVFFVFGAIFEYGAYRSGNQSSVKSIVNLTFSAIAAFGDPVGLIIGIAYFGLDALGVFERPDFENMAAPMFDPFQPYYHPADNTRVAIPAFIPELIPNSERLNTSPMNSINFERLFLNK